MRKLENQSPGNQLAAKRAELVDKTQICDSASPSLRGLGVRLPEFSALTAIIVGTLTAGMLEIAGVFGFWAIRGVPPLAILQSIATSVLGSEARELGLMSALIGLLLHFAVSFVFAAAYVLVSAKLRILRQRPILFGLAYGLLAHFIMSFIVVPLSLADFGRPWPPPPVDFVATLFVHLILFGLPIALSASRIKEY